MDFTSTTTTTTSEGQMARRSRCGQQPRQRAGDEQRSLQVSSAPAKSATNQLSGFVLFASLVLLLNLCPPFQVDFEPTPSGRQSLAPSSGRAGLAQLPSQRECLSYFDASLEFVKLMFTQPMRLEARATRFTLAEARVLGKMAKVWYIKKKIKKLSKKLKKHTIAVPVFTAIPIYEHSYYPQPHVTHVTHGAAMHHAAASSYAPSVAQVTSGAASPLAAAASSAQQMTAAASNQHAAAAYRLAPPAAAAAHHGHHHGPAAALYAHPHGAGSHHIINAYTPSQPLYVDDSGGLYGQYGNAYGRYDGGYHIW